VTLRIRDAGPQDAAIVLKFIKALAEYERLSGAVEADVERVRDTLFGPQPRVFCSIAEWQGEPAGFALWFYSFSTFLARHGIWLEDLFVRPELRGKGIGKALLTALAQRCVSEELGRLEWSVLDWNEPSIRFYRAMGATQLGEWQTFRLTGPELARVGLGGSSEQEV
jgi:GNAT superfamily N-acetyltransferase